jgi:branched-chain amino acid transport system ATP-binding protein
LAPDPALVLLDEPTAGMSREETTRAIETIRRLTRGRTLVMIEHDMEVVFGLADAVTVLAEGRVLATGSPQSVRANAEVQAAYLGALHAGTSL